MNEHNRPKPINILLIEDNPGDAELVRIALEQAKLYNQLLVVRQPFMMACVMLGAWMREIEG